MNKTNTYSDLITETLRPKIAWCHGHIIKKVTPQYPIIIKPLVYIHQMVGR